MEDENMNFETGMKRIGEMLSNEIPLIRTIFISCLTVIVICILLYFNYILIGQFFTTIFLAFITSLALMPTKDKLILKINDHISCHKYFTNRCAIVKILRSFYFYLNRFIVISKSLFKLKINDTKNAPSVETTPVKSRNNSFGAMSLDTVLEVQHLTMFNDIRYLFIVCAAYVIIFKLDFMITCALTIGYLLLDMLIRLLLDFMIAIIKLFDSEEVNENIHSVIAFMIILFASAIILLITIVSVYLFYIDIQSMYSAIRTSNSEYMHQFQTLFEDNTNNLYRNNIYSRIASFESVINSTIAENISTDLLGNYTIFGKF